MPSPALNPRAALFFLCDIQTKFKPAIYGYNHVVATANKMLKLAKLLSCEVIATTQNNKALGPIDPDIDLSSLGPLLVGVHDKTLFSMLTAEVKNDLNARPHIDHIVLFGIETMLDLTALSKPYSVHIIADGVSSCNQFEAPIALARMQKTGAVITTSESIAFQLVKDAAIPEFKTFSRMIKEEKENTKRAGEILITGTSDQVGDPLKSAM